MEQKCIKEALSYYNIPETEAVLLRHNENMTFRVGKDYLLQIHDSVEGFQTQHIYEGVDRIMVIREPIKNCNGELITKLNNGIMVTVSKWVEGESLNKLEMTSEYCTRIGELTAALHRCAKGFQGFPVIAYDGQQCVRIKESVRNIEGCGLNPAYFKTIQRSCDMVGIALQKVQNEFLVLHADLSPFNILATKGGIFHYEALDAC